MTIVRRDTPPTRRRTIGVYVGLVAACLHLCACVQTVMPPSPDGVMISDFDASSQRKPTAKTLYAMAKLLASQGQSNESEIVLINVSNSHPRFLPTYCYLAELRMMQGRIDAAGQALAAGLRLFPQDSVLLNNMGMCALLKRDYERALKYFTKASGFAPQQGRYRDNMALILGLLGRYEESLTLYNQILPPQDASHNLRVISSARGADRLAVEVNQADKVVEAKYPGGAVEPPYRRGYMSPERQDGEFASPPRSSRPAPPGPRNNRLEFLP